MSHVTPCAHSSYSFVTFFIFSPASFYCIHDRTLCFHSPRFPLSFLFLLFFFFIFFFFSSRRRHTRSKRDWSSDVCSSDLYLKFIVYYAMSMPLNFLFISNA